MSHTGSNHKTNWIESLFEQGQIQTRSSRELKGWSRELKGIESRESLGRTGSNHGMNKVDRLKKSRMMGRTGSNHGSNRVKS